jgi:hypothetical protein
MKVSAKEYAINALEVTKEVILFDLDKYERKKAIGYLKKSDLTNPAANAMLSMLRSFKQITKHNQSKISSIKELLFNQYVRLVKQKWFSTILISFFVFYAIYRMARSLFSVSLPLSFAQIGEILFSAVSSIFIIQGIYFIQKKQRHKAYDSFKTAVLISIFLTQFFLFLRTQLAALWAFVASIIVYSSLQYLIDQEKLVHRSSKKLKHSINK